MRRKKSNNINKILYGILAIVLISIIGVISPEVTEKIVRKFKSKRVNIC